MQHVGRHRDGAGRRDLGRRLLDHLALEIGRLELQHVAGGADQHVRQDRDRGPPLDHARDVAQCPQQVSAFDHNPHEAPFASRLRIGLAGTLAVQPAAMPASETGRRCSAEAEADAVRHCRGL